MIRITEELVQQFDYAFYKFCDTCDTCFFSSDEELPDGGHCLLIMAGDIFAELKEKEAVKQ